MRLRFSSKKDNLMSPNRGFGRKCGRFYFRFAEEIAEKQQQQYSVACLWLDQEENKFFFNEFHSVYFYSLKTKKMFLQVTF